MEQRTEEKLNLTREEEDFLIEAEKEEQKKPCFDARALRQIGLAETEINLLQLFFMKARGASFNVRKFTESECLTRLVSALKYLPKTDATGRITLESYQASDNIHNCEENTQKWHEGFRHDFSNAQISSHKERREPVLLDVLRKVFQWIEKFQKAHGLFVELPQWLRDGMQGDFKSDSWIGSDLYEGDKTPPVNAAKNAREASRERQPAAPAISLPQRQSSGQAPLFSGHAGPSHQSSPKAQTQLATEKQKRLLKKLMTERCMPATSLDIDKLTRKEASRRIDELFQESAGHRQEAAA
jgi:hypothetical protein